MASLYTNENVPASVVGLLIERNHDCLTSLQAGNANQRIPDEQVLAFALSSGRVVLTNNRWDFIKLHRKGLGHCGIVVFTYDPDSASLAERIHGALSDERASGRFLARVERSGYHFDKE